MNGPNHSSPSPPPHRDPIIFDTFILVAIQSGFYLLSRRFLAHALPTLRSISKQGTAAATTTASPVSTSARDQDGEYAMKSLDGSARRYEAPGGGDSEMDEEEDDRLLNASGGFSDIEAGLPHRHTGPTHLDRFRRNDNLESDSEDDNISDYTASYAGSPAPSPSLQLSPSHSGNNVEPFGSGMINGASTIALNKQEAGMATGAGAVAEGQQEGKGHARRISTLHQPHASPTIRTPVGITGASSGIQSAGGRRNQGSQQQRVIRLFKSRSMSFAGGSGAGAGRTGLEGREKEKEKVGATRSLGWLSRNLFSLCFAESLTLLLLVMFHSIGILHSRSRHVHFSISLHVLLLLILFVVPWVQCMQLTYRAREVSPLRFTPQQQGSTGKHRLSVVKRVLISLVPFGLYVFLFTRIPPYVTTLDVPSSSPFSGNGTLLDSLWGYGNTSSSSLSSSWSQFVNGTRRVPPPGYRLKGVFPQKVHLGNMADLEEIDDVEEDTNDIDNDDDDNEKEYEYEYEYDQEAYEQYDYAFEYYSQQQMWRRGGWLEPSLGRVVVCGVVVLGGLSGLGAVRTAWNFIEGGGLGSGRPLTREDLISAERSLYRIRHDTVYKRSELARRLGGGADGDGGNSASSHGWMGRVFASTLGRNQETNSLRREIQGLEALESQVERGLEAMKLRRKRQRFARTIRGKAFNLVGLLFAVYCIARVTMCFTSILFPPLATSKIPTQGEESNEPGFVQEKGNTNGDSISYLIAWGLSQLPTGVADVAVWSRAISLLLTGLLILSSLLQVLRSVAKVLRLTSKRIGAGFLLLTLGQLMSTYTISLLIQLRSFIPPSMPDIDVGEAIRANSTAITTITSQFSSHGETSLLASLPEFRVFGRLFDVMFLVGAISTALYRYMSQKMNGVDEYAQVYH